MTPNYAQTELWFEYDTQYIGKDVDIFYIYPTVNCEPLKNEKTIPTFTNIHLPEVRKAASRNQLYNKAVYAAGDFNFFAPYYRQMTTKVFEMSKNVRNRCSRISYSDVMNAFQYYMEHFNNGRRFILLGHSQGSQMLIELLKRGMTDEQHQQMVAAYLMGFKISQNEIDKYPIRLKPAQGELDKGVVISYNSVHNIEAISPLLHKNVVCINPLNWKTDSTLADISLHKGTIRYSKKEGKYVTTPHYTRAYIQDAFLVCPDVDPAICYNEKIKKPFPMGNLHFADSWLFAENIKENIRKRCQL